MKYATIVVVVLVILGAAGFYFYSDRNDSSQNQSASKSMMQKDEVTQQSGDSMQKTDAVMDKGSDSAVEKSEGVNMEGVVMQNGSGEYVEYSDPAFKSASDKKRVLYFYANWCPTCKPLDAELKANMDKIPAGVVILRVNYNDTDTDAPDKALAAKYGITYQHTFVQVDNQGNEVTKWNGGGLDKIVSSVK